MANDIVLDGEVDGPGVKPKAVVPPRSARPRADQIALAMAILGCSFYFYAIDSTSSYSPRRFVGIILWGRLARPAIVVGFICSIFAWCITIKRANAGAQNWVNSSALVLSMISTGWTILHFFAMSLFD